MGDAWSRAAGSVIFFFAAAAVEINSKNGIPTAEKMRPSLHILFFYSKKNVRDYYTGAFLFFTITCCLCVQHCRHGHARFRLRGTGRERVEKLRESLVRARLNITIVRDTHPNSAGIVIQAPWHVLFRCGFAEREQHLTRLPAVPVVSVSVRSSR